MSVDTRALARWLVALLVAAAIPAAAWGDDYVRQLLEETAHVLVHTEGDRSLVLFPAITTDPNTGPTYGPLPVLIWLGENKEIRHILAASLTYNDTFGITPSLRYDFFPAPESRFTLLGFVSQHTNYRALVRYEDLAALGGAWRTDFALEKESDGSRRFFGFGSSSPSSNESAYTLEEGLLVADIGRTVANDMALVVGAELRRSDVRQSPIEDLPEIPSELRGTTSENGPRVALVYDTRDLPRTPTRGAFVTLSGFFPRRELGSEASFVRLLFDARGYLPLVLHEGWPGTLAGRIRLQQSGWGSVPFPSQAFLGGANLLRGFGEGRFVDRALAVASVEDRITVYRLDLLNRFVELEIAPFFEVGTVSDAVEHMGSERFHPVGGLGFRGVVRPTIVGKVDVGVGDDGPAVFTGIDYPF